jgi:hypothetical protein
MSVWEIIDAKSRQALIEYQWRVYGLKLEDPVQLHRDVIKAHYPDTAEADKNMRQVIGEISPNRTRL